MRVIAITGGIGAGKSLASSHFADRGAIVLDLDVIAKALLDGPGEVHERVIAEFGDAVLDADGRIDRAALAREAFASDESSARLNRIVHPAVLGELAVGLDELALMGQPPRAVVVEVPMLVEAPAIAELADSVLTVAAPEEVRLKRCTERGMAAEDVRMRMARQSTDEDRAELADAVIENVGDEREFVARLDEFWKREVGPSVA